MTKKILSIAVVIILISALVSLFFARNVFISEPEDIDESISSFRECVEAGYAVLDSYPEKCETLDGKMFVRNLPEEEISNIISFINVEGTITCLSHWDTSGPQTMECAFGLESHEGDYYVLRDLNPLNPVIFDFPTGSEVEIKGMFTPGSHERYQSIGVIDVEEIREL